MQQLAASDDARSDDNFGEQPDLTPTPTPARDITVTIVITNYNYADYIPDAIASVLNQSPAPTRVLVIDDGSTDHSREVLSRYEGLLEVVYRENMGIVTTRNHALQLAITDFVLFLDADNELLPGCLETMTALAARHADDDRLALIYGARREFGLRTGLQTPGTWDVARIARYNYIDNTVLLDRQKALEVGGYATAMDAVGCEDWDLWLSLIERGYHGLGTDEPVFRYRIHSRGSRTDKALLDLETLRQVIVARHPWIAIPIKRSMRLRIKNRLTKRQAAATGIDTWMRDPTM